MTEEKDKGPIVMMPCRRGSDKITANESCDSRQAYKLSKDGERSVRYECVKCRHLWFVALGGSFQL